ncbi:hypothetical protein [Rhodococcus sp. JVH1]|uniref:hypothetical protein n=1 Tax=Rhodococcus sp. JVH1 TaxID=745408 RepID=UPI0012F6841E|nr:hypothetical protein [Rhodococcus sp. JVH1]
MPITLATLHIPPELPTADHGAGAPRYSGKSDSWVAWAGHGISGRSPNALPQHLCVRGCEVVVEQNRCGLVTLDQHPLVRQPGRGSVVEECRHHRVVDEVEGNARDSVLEAAERSCRGCDSHAFDSRWYDVHAYQFRCLTVGPGSL